MYCVCCTDACTLITDGLPAYRDAYMKEFWTLRNPRTKHIRHIKIRGDHNNNKMERLNGELRDRESHERAKEKGYANTDGVSNISQLHPRT